MQQFQPIRRGRLGRPRFILVNKYAFHDVADSAFAKAQLIIADAALAKSISVRTIENNGVPYVGVFGDTPDREVRRKLAQVFSIGEPVDEPDREIKEIFKSVP